MLHCIYCSCLYMYLRVSHYSMVTIIKINFNCTVSVHSFTHENIPHDTTCPVHWKPGTLDPPIFWQSFQVAWSSVVSDYSTQSSKFWIWPQIFGTDKTTSLAVNELVLGQIPGLGVILKFLKFKSCSGMSWNFIVSWNSVQMMEAKWSTWCVNVQIRRLPV